MRPRYPGLGFGSIGAAIRSQILAVRQVPSVTPLAFKDPGNSVWILGITEQPLESKDLSTTNVGFSAVLFAFSTPEAAIKYRDENGISKEFTPIEYRR